MAFTYPKNEKLKRRKTIDLLFSGSQSVSKYPLRLVYAAQEFEDGSVVKVGVSVSKKYFKRASDRNYYKRLLRESYRLNKSSLIDRLEKPHAIMILYQSKDQLTFVEVQSKMLELFEKFHSARQK